MSIIRAGGECGQMDRLLRKLFSNWQQMVENAEKRSGCCCCCFQCGGEAEFVGRPQTLYDLLLGSTQRNSFGVFDFFSLGEDCSSSESSCQRRMGRVTFGDRLAQNAKK